MFASGNSQLGFLDVLTRDRAVRLGAGRRASTWTSTSASTPTHPASFRRYMRERIVDVAHPAEFHEIRGRRARRPAPSARGTPSCCAAHPLDLCCLGIGENGHLAFNDPPVADFDDPLDVKVVELDDACRRQQVGEGHFADRRRGADARDHGHDPGAASGAATVLAIVPEARKASPCAARSRPRQHRVPGVDPADPTAT